MLITLGIIGVVAVITVPTVINNIQDKQNIAKWKKEFSVINNAYQLVLNEGVSVNQPSPYHNSFTQEFIDKMREKLNVADACNDGVNACDYLNYQQAWQLEKCKYKWSGVANVFSRYKALGSNINNKTYDQHGINSYNFRGLALLLNDGAAIYFGGSHGGPWIVVDVNNFNKGPNEFGRDVFVIKFSDSGSNWLKPVGAEGTYNKIGNGEICECSKDKGLKTSSWLANPAGGGNGEYISGACCSAYYLYNK